MRNKPLLHPVVAALERQEAINRYLLEQINVLRVDMGYDHLSMDYVTGVIDGQSIGQSPVSSEVRNVNPAPSKASRESSQPQSQHTQPSAQHIETPILEKEVEPSGNIKGVKKYAEALEDVDGGLELGCDDFNLTEEEGEYVFEVDGEKADFYINPAKADSLMRVSQRSSWANVAKIESGPIPELNDNQKYEIKIQTPGAASLVDGYWIIETPVSILISVK